MLNLADDNFMGLTVILIMHFSTMENSYRLR